MGNVLRTMPATASAFQMTCTTASAFWRSSVRAFFLLDTECQGKCNTDNACHDICLLDKECQGIFPSGCRVSRHMYYGRCVPWQLLSGQGVSGHFSFWTQRVKAYVLRTTCAVASGFWTRSVRAFFLPDAECQGICNPDDTFHGIYLPGEECQGTLLSGRRVSRHMYYGRRVPWQLPFR